MIKKKKTLQVQRKIVFATRRKKSLKKYKLEDYHLEDFSRRFKRKYK